MGARATRSRAKRSPSVLGVSRPCRNSPAARLLGAIRPRNDSSSARVVLGAIRPRRATRPRPGSPSAGSSA
eukprot:10496081-Lingulodinium_polyedra.AAC.1